MTPAPVGPNFAPPAAARRGVPVHAPSPSLHDGLAPPGSRPALDPTLQRPRLALSQPPPDEVDLSRAKRWATAAVLAMSGLAGLGLWAAGPVAPSARPAPGAGREVLQGVEGLRLRSPRVVLTERKALHLPPWHRFPTPVDLRGREVEVAVRVPEDLARRPGVVLQMWARDDAGRSQTTTWTEGQVTAANPGYDTSSRTLRLRYTPTAEEVTRQGETEPGFDPSRIRSLGFVVGVQSANPDLRTGRLEVAEVLVRPTTLDTRPAEVRPLLRAVPGPARPLKPSALQSGVSRYFGYGELHRWDQAEPQVREVFQRQQGAGLHGFRWMGGLDLRAGGVGPEVFRAMDRYLELAGLHGQSPNMVTLLDGAIPNATLREAMRDPSARAELVETLRPFVQRYGNAQVNGQPVIFDLVNEIHGVGGVSDRQRQELVNDLVDLFVQEAPGATLTVGVQNHRELDRWTYLFERYEGQPVTFLPTFHLYEDIESLPNAWELNLPDGVPVGITEARAGSGVARQVEAAARKGYSWLLFWEDAGNPYSAAEHGQAVR